MPARYLQHRRAITPGSRRLRVANWWCGALLTLAMTPSCSLLRSSHGEDYWASPHFTRPPPPWSRSRTLRVVTFNIKDMYWLSDHRAERMAAIGEALAGLRPDIVCLQEAFVGGDVAILAEALASIGVDFPSGVLGSGLWTFSRYPILEVFFRRFTQNGSPWDTKGGDWWAGKGVGLARLELAPGELLDVYNTHMICNLGPAELVAHRRLQVREYAAFALGATPPSVPALLLGDFNCGYGGQDSRFLHDVMRWAPMLQRRFGYDHIFARSAAGAYRFTPLGEAVVKGRVTIAGRATPVSLSDHLGLLATLHVEPPAPPSAAAGPAAPQAAGASSRSGQQP
jgi:endonuclease/exonuclease/phosphatase family metal-dependent hydrolase